MNSQVLAQIRARDAAKGRSGAGVTMTAAERDRRVLLALRDDVLIPEASQADPIGSVRAVREDLADARRRLRAVEVLVEPITCSPGDDSLVGYAIQDVAAARRTPAEVFADLGEEWADALAQVEASDD